MIFEVHQYKCRYLGAPAQIKLYDELGRAAHERHCGKPAVFGVGETGEVDSYTHIMSYEDNADRARRREALLADPEWQAYMKACREAGNILSREIHVLRAAPFFGT